MILDQDLLKPKGKKKNDHGEVAKGKEKKGDDEVAQGKKKRTDDEEVPQGKEAEEATSANDDKRKNAQLQAAKKEFRAFVQSNDVKPENYVSTLKKFFGQKEYQRKYDAKRQATPHRKAWQKEYDAKRRATPQYKAYKKECDAEYRKRRRVEAT